MVKMFARYGTTLPPNCQVNTEQIYNLQRTIYNFNNQYFT